MRVLVLGEIGSPITTIVKANGNEVVEWIDPIGVDYLRLNRINFIVSFGYRHIIKQPVLEYLSERVINLHISYLPWNRGADPNLWSFLEDTPKGVTIHYVDEGIDTGDIIAQERVEFSKESETLATTYQKLRRGIIDLFAEIWLEIIAGTCPRQKQPSGGSCHKTSDKKRFEYLFVKGWATPVVDLRGKAIPEA